MDIENWETLYKNPGLLSDWLREYFYTVDRLRNLCQHLNVNFHQLEGEGINKATDLTEHLIRRKQVPNLFKYLETKEPELLQILVNFIRANQVDAPEIAGIKYTPKPHTETKPQDTQRLVQNPSEQVINPPKVFISYSWDSDEHQGRVLELANKLRDDGIDCHIDQYEPSPSEGWPQWMNNKLDWADFVLVICTEKYHRRFRGAEEPGKGRGVTWEGAIINQNLYDAQGKNAKYIPVVFSSDDLEHIPVVLRSSSHYTVNSSRKYEEIYRRLTNQPSIVMPPIGNLKQFPHKERKQNFLE